MEEPDVRKRRQVLKREACHADLRQIIRDGHARRILALPFDDALDGAVFPDELERAVRSDVLYPLRKVGAEEERKVDVARAVELEGVADGVAVDDDDGGFARGDAAQHGGLVDEHVGVLAHDVVGVTVGDEGTRERFCLERARGLDARDAHGTQEFLALVVCL